jgi:glucose-6-phosphate 1-dehydrogenase
MQDMIIQDLFDVVEYIFEREGHKREEYIDAFGEDSDLVQNHIATKALRLLAAAEPGVDDQDRAYGPNKGE